MKQATTAVRLDPSFCPTPSPPRCHPFDTCDILWISILVLNLFREQVCEMQDCPPEWKDEGWTKVFKSPIANLMFISPYRNLCVSLIASQLLLVFLGLSAVQTCHLLPIGCFRAPDSAWWGEVKSPQTHIIVKIKLELSLPILGARDQNQMALELVMATGPQNMMIWARWKKMMIRKNQECPCHHEQMRTHSGLVGGV